ncbi:MAG: phenylalanine--tRNA ligase subunit beta [Patescibacteria group bacterium]
MKVSLNWLKEYVAIRTTPEKLADDLTICSVEVNTIEKTSGNISNVVVAEILGIKKHPNADKLNLVSVNNGKEKFEVVCGGVNIKPESVGKKVPFAMVGAKLPNGMELKKANIRGVESCGMICSSEELGLPKKGDHEILFLDDKAKIGNDVVKELGLDDVVLDLDVLANRPDLMGHFGVAREIAAITGSKLKRELYDISEEPKKNQIVKVEVKDVKLCPRYSALVISGIKVGPSPEWVRKRLESVGVRSINNIVDLTNYIMLDRGQPLHAFDYDKIKGKTMTVRPAKNGEKVTTLDSKTWNLEAGMLIIEDGERIIDLAGIMGGANSEINEKTKTIVLQAAAFDPITIRRTSRKLGARTDAVGRYEKTVDPNQTLAHLTYTFSLLKEMMPTAILEQVVDIGTWQLEPVKITVNTDKIENILGIKIPAKEIISILNSLGAEVTKRGKNTLEVLAPTYRPDLKIPEDIIEEISRIYGYNKLGESVPTGNLEPPVEPKYLSRIRQVKAYFKGKGFTEVYNYSFTSKENIQRMGLKISDHIEVANPLASNQQYLRTELLSGLLNNVHENLKHTENLKLFELSNVYFPKTGGKTHEAPLLSAVITGESKDGGEFFELKGTLEQLFEEQNVKYESELLEKSGATDCPYWDAYNTRKSLKFTHNGKVIATLSQLSGTVAKNFDLDRPIYFLVVFLDYLTTLKIFNVLPKYPSVMLDVAFVIDRKILYKQIEHAVWQAGGELLARVELFDVYIGKQIGDGKKSMALHLDYRADDRTLSLAEAQKFHNQIIKSLEQKFNAQIRAQ